jgi:uncharacterized protein (TIRG00374 family)
VQSQDDDTARINRSPGDQALEEDRTLEKRSASWMIGVGISVAALILAFWGVQPARFIQVFREANYLYLLPGAALMILGLVARALSWRVLLGDRVPFGRTFTALNEGYLLNSVLPFRLGELARAYLVGRGQNISGADALSSVVMERLIDVMVSLLGLLASLPFVVRPQWAEGVALVAGVGLVIGVLGLLAVLRLERPLMELLDRVLGEGWAPIGDSVGEFLSGLRKLTNRPARLVLAAFWSLMAWLTMWLLIWLLIGMFGHSASWIVPLFTAGVIAFGAAIPSSPGALGVYEVSMLAGLLVFDYPRESAIGVAIIAHGLHLLISGGIGAAALARDGGSVLALANRAQAFFQRTREAQVT